MATIIVTPETAAAESVLLFCNFDVPYGCGSGYHVAACFALDCLTALSLPTPSGRTPAKKRGGAKKGGSPGRHGFFFSIFNFAHVF